MRSIKHRSWLQWCSLTFSEGVVDSEAAQDFIHISGMEEAITSDHHLEGLWVKTSEAQTVCNTSKSLQHIVLSIWTCHKSE